MYPCSCSRRAWALPGKHWLSQPSVTPRSPGNCRRRSRLTAGNRSSTTCATEPSPMTRPGPTHYQSALAAACARAGLDARDAAVLHIRANAVYHLPREGVVARIRYAPGGPGAVLERYEASIRVTRWLRGQEFPATEPLDVDQPVVVADHVATFWRYVITTGTTGRDAATLGHLLRRLHALPPPDVSLPAANLLGSLRVDLDSSDVVTAGERDWLLARAAELEQQYQRTNGVLGTGRLHGDAHSGNLLHSPVVWCWVTGTRSATARANSTWCPPACGAASAGPAPSGISSASPTTSTRTTCQACSSCSSYGNCTPSPPTCAMPPTRTSAPNSPNASPACRPAPTRRRGAPCN